MTATNDHRKARAWQVWLPNQAAQDASVFLTELGWMAAQWIDGKLARLTLGHASEASALSSLKGVSQGPDEATAEMEDLIDRLQQYAAGEQVLFGDMPLYSYQQTRFQRAVLRRCRRIPYGSVMTYAQLAQSAGFPKAARAVGNVMASNRTPLIIPCHRVVGAGGKLGGFSAPTGVDLKRRLLALEKASW